ncbi:MAG TPA: hypothetical protein VFE38_09640 [Edaphobacter sp.]|nr:hypothetical protein [Edaphobacter sp.]
MSHITVELHEKYPYEHIAEWEYDFVHERMKLVGCFQDASTRGTDEYLPRGCYFSETATFEGVKQAWSDIKTRLGRHVSMEFTIGTSYGLGLKPVVPRMTAPSFMEACLPLARPTTNLSSLYGTLLTQRQK